MRKIRLLNLLAITVLGTSVMYGQASRTWVSGVGDDANPCSRTAPCKTFAGAISKTAAGGEIDALDPQDTERSPLPRQLPLTAAGDRWLQSWSAALTGSWSRPAQPTL